MVRCPLLLPFHGLIVSLVAFLVKHSKITVNQVRQVTSDPQLVTEGHSHPGWLRDSDRHHC